MKNRITNERDTLCMYHVACHAESHLYCLIFYNYACMYCICESNSVALQINLFIIIIYSRRVSVQRAVERD